MNTFTIGSLFSGIGGIELGLERAGLGPVVWQCELDPFCRRVLAKHWPNVERFEDVTRPREWPRVELVCGGFPCTDVSSAGKRRGIGGEHSSLWRYFARVVRQVRPRFVVVENVASGLRQWLPTVRRDLHVLGYRTRAYRISAADVGAPHLRRRVFVVAYANGEQLRIEPGRSIRKDGRSSPLSRLNGATRTSGDTNGDSEPTVPQHGEVAIVRGMASGASAWATPPEFRRMDDGLRGELDGRRLKALGNSVVPQCAEAIGRIIMKGLAA